MDKLRPFHAVTGDRNLAVSVADPAQEDCPLVFVNSAFEALTGYRSEEILGRNCRFLQGAQTQGEAIDELRGAIADEQSVSVCLLNYRSDGRPFHNLLFMEPIHFDDGACLFMGCQYEIDARSFGVKAHVDSLNIMRDDLRESWQRARLMRDDALAMRAEAVAGLVRTYMQSDSVRPF